MVTKGEAGGFSGPGVTAPSGSLGGGGVGVPVGFGEDVVGNEMLMLVPGATVPPGHAVIGVGGGWSAAIAAMKRAGAFNEEDGGGGGGGGGDSTRQRWPGCHA